MLKASFVLVAFAVYAFALPIQKEELLPTTARLSNGQRLSVSGLSAGGFMAQQFAVAYSANVSGVAVFAGGPFYCALGKEMHAITACMNQAEMVLVPELVVEAKKFEKEGKIDSLENLKSQRVYLYSGRLDTVVFQGVVKKIEKFYSELGAAVTKTKYDVLAAHGWPTTNYGNACAMFGSPYVQNCKYDGAGDAMQTLYDEKLEAPKAAANDNNMIKLKQKDFIPQGKSHTGIDETGYAYIPTACQANSTKCDVHVSFHGCSQDFAAVSDAFVGHVGLNEWAESNSIIVLYPQAAKALIKNPKGCFDWWGYADKDYAFKTGAQMVTTMNMVEHLASGGR